MRLTGIICGWLGALVLASGAGWAQTEATSQQTPARHAFAAKDWATLRSASATAMSPDGTILYQVNFGGATGPTHKEWWTTSADGSHAMKLTLSDDFSPKGFTSDGKS